MTTQDFQDIWTSDKLNTVRADLADGNRYEAPRNCCDVMGTWIGKKHIHAWEKCAEARKKNDT